MIEKIIAYSEANQRIDKYVRKALNDAPLSFIYKLFRKKDVKIDGKPVKIDYKINAGETIRIYVTDQQLADFMNPQATVGRDLAYPIVYEDENILIVNKPANMLVHSDEGNAGKKTLTDHVLSYLTFKDEYNPRVDLGFAPGPAHRIDRNTTGLVVFGKNIEALQELGKLFSNKKNLDKYYLTLVSGRLRKDGEINASLLKDEKHNMSKVSTASYAKPALTKYSVVSTFKDTTLLNVQIITGRTHQIRVHMQYIMHPIVNDGKYGDFDFNREFERRFGTELIFLHAFSLQFREVPGILNYLSGITFEAPLPKNKQDIVDALEKESRI